MGETVGSIAETIIFLRTQQAATLARMPQDQVIAILSGLSERWGDPANRFRREAETWLEPFPWAMVQVSLDALLESLSPANLKALIDSEDVSDTFGYPVIGQIVAGNTPLLAWVGIIRALLVRSASFVKLPSNAAADWAHLFHRSLAHVAPELAACVHLASWPGGTATLDGALCIHTDLILAHGSDSTLHALRACCPPETPFVGYGHRVSFGLLLPEADWGMAAQGFAKDVLIYDQGGCLSAQTIFVEGDWNDTQRFGAVLAEALQAAALHFPLPVRAAQAAQTVREARELAWMESGNILWEDPGQRWTVIARPGEMFAASPTFGVVSVQPLASLKALPAAVSAVADRLQGCAMGGCERSGYLLGVSRLCEPGALQAPPLGWRQDGRDVLRVLLPPSH